MNNGSSWNTLQVLDSYTTDILFSPDSQMLAAAAQDRTVWLWNAKTHRHLLTIQNPHDFVIKLKFSPDGLTLATASRDKTVRLWNTTSGAHIKVMRYGIGFVREINFLPQSLEVLESSDVNAWSWNLKWTPKTIKAHKFSLTAAAQAGMSEPKISGIDLDEDEEWITKDSKRLVWLPPEYRPTDWVRSESAIFIGCTSGRVLRVQDI